MENINDENLEFLDGYDEVEQEKVRSIKTREQSFDNIHGFWEKRRFEKLSKKLEKAEEKLLSQSFKTDSNGQLTAKDEKKIIKKTQAIAKIEQEIKFLKGEYVPEDFVLNRAIKLKDNMYKNLRFNSQNAYSVGLDKYDEIFSEEKEEVFESAAPVVDVAEVAGEQELEEEKVSSEVVEDSYGEDENHLDSIIQDNERKIAEEVQAVLAEKEKEAEKIEVVPSEVERQHIKDAVDDMFSSVQLDKADDNEDIFRGIDEEIAALKGEDTMPVIGGDDIQESVDEAMEDVSLDDEQTIDASEIEGAIDEAIAGVEDEPELDYSDIKAELDKAMESIRVSKNGTAAKLDKYDENGQFKTNEIDEEDVKTVIDEAMEEEKNYDYKPMTDEEIARARENIEYDKYEDLYHNVKHEEEPEKKESFSLIVPEVKFDDIFKPVAQVDANQNVESPKIDFDDEIERELPVVVPEREEITAYEKEQENVSEDVPDYAMEDEGLHFDYSTATADEVNAGFNQANSLGEFAELRKRAEELKEKQRKSREDRAAAEREAEEAAMRAQEIKEAALAKQRDYEKRLEKLRLFTEALAEDVEFNTNKAELAKNDAKCNERFAEAQKEKTRNIDNMINEIDSIIGPEATNVRRGK